MKNEPEIIKMLRMEEKLGKLHNRRQSSCEEIQIPETIPEKPMQEKNCVSGQGRQTATPDIRLDDVEHIYQTVFENSAVAITLTDEHEHIISWNKYAENLLGMTKDDLCMKPVALLYPPEEWEKIRSKNVRQKGIQHHLETTLIRGDKKLIDVDISLSVLKDHNGKVIGSIGVIKDITERKQIERALAASEVKFKQLYEKAPIPYHTLSPEGIITNVNECWCDILGYDKDDVIGRPIFDFIYEKEREASRTSFKDKISSKKVYSRANERTFVTKDGDTHIFMIHDSLLFDHNANIIAVYTTMEDVTEHKQIEKEVHDTNEMLEVVDKELERKVQERTAEIEKLLKQKDEFIGQLGHDLKTPLSILLNILPMLKDELVNGDSKKDCDIAIRNVYYISSLIIDTLKLAELSWPNVKFTMSPLELRETVTGIIADNQQIFNKKHITVKNTIDNAMTVEGDELRLEEVFTNLITNAVKFTPENGIVTIGAKRAGDDVTVSVSDTGVGLSQEQTAHIFDEFYKAETSRSDATSSGLGLIICKRIIKRHGGTIWVESQGKGKGTTVHFTLKCK